MRNITNWMTLALGALLVSSASFAAPAAKKAAPAPTQKVAVAQKAATAYKREYGMAGCGLGSMVVGRSGGQIFAATTNGTSANQLFGITLGTSNCNDDPNAETAQRLDSFIAANKLALASDIARGEGETLNNVSAMLGCSSSNGFGQAMQKNFRTIFPDTRVQPNEVTDSIMSVIKLDQNLARSCGDVV